MYEFVDRPVAQQIASVRLTVWAIRRWARAAQEGRCVCGLITSVLGASQVPEAATPLLQAMRILMANLRTSFRVGGVESCHITEHEAVLLGALVAAGEGRAQDCRSVARLLVHPDMVPAMSVALIRLAEAFARADMHLVAAGAPPAREG